MDLVFHNKLIKLVAVYCPTTDYPLASLEQVYLDLQDLVEETLRNHGHCIIGGDFNTVYDHGERGQLLNEFLASTDLDLANHPDRCNPDFVWTHRGCRGFLRQIDFLLVTKNLH